jgi:hypothetical protein
LLIRQIAALKKVVALVARVTQLDFYNVSYQTMVLVGYILI